MSLKCLFMGHKLKKVESEYGFGDSPLDRANMAAGEFPDLLPEALNSYMRARKYICTRCGRERRWT